MKKTDLALVRECMTSIDLAILTEKRHADILRDIREMSNAWEKVTERKFALSAYTDSTGRSLPMFKLKKDEILFIVSKYNDELRAIIISRLVELERKKDQHSKDQIMQLKLQNDRLWDKSDREDLYSRK